MWQEVKKRLKRCTSMKTIETNHQYSRQSTTRNWTRISIDDRKRSLPVWIYGLLWTIQEPQLPPKDFYYRSLIEEDISEIDYTHTQTVFNHFDMTDLGDSMSEPTCFYWPTHWIILGSRASKIMVLIPPIITLSLICPGYLLLKLWT